MTLSLCVCVCVCVRVRGDLLPCYTTQYCAVLCCAPVPQVGNLAHACSGEAKLRRGITIGRYDVAYMVYPTIVHMLIEERH